ncbi:MAG: Maf family protein [Candidatus Sericytochromatia bacterium]
MMRLILASGSPRRVELLGRLTPHFEVIPADIAEHLQPDITDIGQRVAQLALEKAQAVAAQQHGDCQILGADTVVCLDGDLLGKPRDAAHAEHMLSRLSGRTHQVITGLGLVTQHKGQRTETLDFASSDVSMRVLSPEEIQTYVASGEPLDKAGAYAIQGGAAAFVTAISGSYENIVGLPLECTARLLALSTSPTE